MCRTWIQVQCVHMLNCNSEVQRTLATRFLYMSGCLLYGVHAEFIILEALCAVGNICKLDVPLCVSPPFRPLASPSVRLNACAHAEHYERKACRSADALTTIDTNHMVGSATA